MPCTVGTAGGGRRRDRGRLLRPRRFAGHGSTAREHSQVLSRLLGHQRRCGRQAVLAVEPANRTYFAASVSDRGDDYFHQFTDRYNALNGTFAAPADRRTWDYGSVSAGDGLYAGRVR